MADLVYTLGLDDTEFQTTLKGSQASVNDAAGSVGRLVQEQTSGVRTLVRSFSGVLAIGAGAVGIFATIAGAVVSIGTAIEGYANAGVKARDAAREEARERERTARALEQSVAALRASGGGGRGDAETVEGIARERARLLNDLGSAAARYAAWPQIALAAESAINDVLARRGRMQTSLLDQTRVETLRNEGRDTEALMEQERLNHADRLVRIRELAQGNQSVIDELDTAEHRRHESELGRIRREADARRAEDERREAEERRRTERQEFESSFLSSSIEAENLRLRGMEKEADALEAQERTRRRIRDIEDREGLSDREKARLIRGEEENLGLRLAEIAAGGAGREPDASRRFGSVSATGLNDRSIVAQSLGTSGGPRVQTSDKGLTDVANQLLKGVAEIVDRFRRLPTGQSQSPGFLT